MSIHKVADRIHAGQSGIELSGARSEGGLGAESMEPPALRGYMQETPTRPDMLQDAPPGLASRARRTVANSGQGAPAAAEAENRIGTVMRRMLNRSGNSLFTAVEPLSDAEFFLGGANGISVAWTIGHLACVFDLFTSWIHGGDRKLPKEVHSVFNSLDVKAPGGPSKAEIVAGAGYSKAQIQFLLRGAQIDALKLLSKCTEDDWYAPPPGPHPDNLHTIGEIWEHLAVHTYWHMGELCGTFPRFHGTYTLNMLPHYFYYLPTESGHEQ